MTPSEFEWIEQIGQMAGRGDLGDGLFGIGDDCAIVKLEPESADSDALVVSIDSQVSDIHFRFDWLDFALLGRRVFHVGFSDVAAMGARPTVALMSLEVAADISQDRRDAFMQAFADSCRTAVVRLIGGNVSGRTDGFSAHVVALGRQRYDRILRRSGAKPGDSVYVIGHPGCARAGRSILIKDGAKSADTENGQLLAAYRAPESQWQEGLVLAESGCVTAAIDVSDGLAADLAHLCRASGVGATLEAERLPISGDLDRWCRAGGHDALDYVLQGGEDYVLLFTVNESDHIRTSALHSELERSGAAVTRIGTITRSSELALIHDGKKHDLPVRGFDHLTR